ncbi:hypothetical protein Nepgr_012340 [Nepenthes gracilis]|uniref:RRM domain-containing protein n=1 Tax=Nepenthes gracilis TaxID=150966 RepID=A0AAD3XN14_NEPGR|nr:hypothetical protein Nepgr_012340 [Nepenthes gracilis]
MTTVEGQFGDLTLRKVFVGGLAWETPMEAVRDHFAKYGEILEAVIIVDRATGRSKGYGFVTFVKPEAAKKACENPTPLINGRRANCNLAALGARRPRTSSTTPPPQLWYYPAGAPPPPPFHYTHHQTLSFFGYPIGQYARTDVGGLMPIHPLYHYHHQSQAVGFPPISADPPLIFKPASLTVGLTTGDPPPLSWMQDPSSIPRDRLFASLILLPSASPHHHCIRSDISFVTDCFSSSLVPAPSLL